MDRDGAGMGCGRAASGTPPVLMHGDRDDRPFVLLTTQPLLGAPAGAPHPPQSVTGRVLVQPPSPTGRRRQCPPPPRTSHPFRFSRAPRVAPSVPCLPPSFSPPPVPPPYLLLSLSIMSTNVVWHEGLSMFIAAAMLCLLLFEFRPMDRTRVAAMRRCSPACAGVCATASHVGGPLARKWPDVKTIRP